MGFYFPDSGPPSESYSPVPLDGQTFLQQLAGFPRRSFEGRFLELALRLRLTDKLTADEFKLLYEAGLYASCCNFAFNGLGGCNGRIRPENETNRTGLELQFMAARDRVRVSSGWFALTPWQRACIQGQFLQVSVAEHNLAK